MQKNTDAIVAYWAVRWCSGEKQITIARECGHTNSVTVSTSISSFARKYAEKEFNKGWPFAGAGMRKVAAVAVHRFKQQQAEAFWEAEQEKVRLTLVEQDKKRREAEQEKKLREKEAKEEKRRKEEESYAGDGSEFPLTRTSDWAFRFACGETFSAIAAREWPKGPKKISAGVRHFVAAYWAGIDREHLSEGEFRRQAKLAFSQVTATELQRSAIVVFRQFVKEWAMMVTNPPKGETVVRKDTDLPHLPATSRIGALQEPGNRQTCNIAITTDSV